MPLVLPRSLTGDIRLTSHGRLLFVAGMVFSEGIWLLATGSRLLASCQKQEASGKKVEPLKPVLTLK